MKLRNLKIKDAPLMLEWMHDNTVVEKLRDCFLDKTINDCRDFIKSSNNKKENIHLAIVSDEDEYMGTVSLKNINTINQSAEFGICVRKCAMGKGFSWFGMEEIIHLAFYTYNLENIYWCVSRDNFRAIRFYDKHNFHEVVDVPQTIKSRYGGGGVNNLKWYSVLKGDMLDEKKEIAGCQIVHIKTIPTVGAGELSFFESTNDVPFDIKRIYFISKVPEGIRRGYHAHKNLKQLLFCPYGRIQLTLENNQERGEIELSDPSIGILIEKPTWREMLWLQKDSVLCVAASEHYDMDDYIRDYTTFKEYLEKNK